MIKISPKYINLINSITNEKLLKLIGKKKK